MKISLKAARINAGLSQNALAEKMGVSKSTISRWEIGILKIPDEKLDYICDICQLDKDDIILKEREEKNGN